MSEGGLAPFTALTLSLIHSGVVSAFIDELDPLSGLGLSNSGQFNHLEVSGLLDFTEEELNSLEKLFFDLANTKASLASFGVFKL